MELKRNIWLWSTVVLSVFIIYITINLRYSVPIEVSPKKPLPVPNTLAQDTKFSKVLLVTTWRSGSTWLGELLASTPNSFYLYEPLLALKNPKNYLQGIDLQSKRSLTLLRDLFSCRLSDSFFEFLHKWPSVYLPQYNSHKAIPNRRITEHCLKSKKKIFKTVRLKLEAVEDFLNDQQFSDLKIIYLIRDPRAIMSSIKKMWKLRNWNLTTNEICPKLVNDLEAYRDLSSRYPRRIIFILYEQLAIQTEDEVERLWNFLQDGSSVSIPISWSKFINRDVAKRASNKSNPFRTEAKSANDFQKWRETIEEDLLLKVEVLCHDVITKLGLRHFESIPKARNMSENIFINLVKLDDEPFVKI